MVNAGHSIKYDIMKFLYIGELRIIEIKWLFGATWNDTAGSFGYKECVYVCVFVLHTSSPCFENGAYYFLVLVLGLFLQ